MASGIPRRKKIAAARKLRANPTPAEARLWSRLRNRRAGGFKFRRQQPLGEFTADFFCAEAKLAVELDGAAHDTRADQDAARDAELLTGGILVLRIRNEAALGSPDQVVARIVALCRERIAADRQT